MQKPKVVPLRSGSNRGRGGRFGENGKDPAANGRKGGQHSARAMQENIAKTREMVAALGPKAAERLTEILEGSKASQVDLMAIASVLDRTIGKQAHVEITDTTPSLFLDAVRELGEEETG